ncbi:hypothetical protein ACM66B_004526 [Microbotryomycetes sp. NB124-2]
MAHMQQLARLRRPSAITLDFSAPCNVLTPIHGLVAAQAHSRTRSYFMQQPQTGPVIIAKAPFVPTVFVEHLFRNKRDSAIAYKWIPESSISNMEGMLHMFVTAFVKIEMIGDYAFRGRHDVQLHTDDRGRLCARACILSTQIQPDFEDEQIAFAFCQLGQSAVVGEPLEDDVVIPNSESKQDDSIRSAWDDRLRRHLIHSLMPDRTVPAIGGIAEPWTSRHAIRALQLDLQQNSPSLDLLSNRAVESHGHLLSLELLANIYICIVANEFSALEACCRQNGYIYTFDPPAIFARMLSPDLLNLLYVYALRIVTHNNRLDSMRVFSFNDYADSSIMSLIRTAFSRHSHVQVLSRADLYPVSTRGYLDKDNEAVKSGAALVIHNNSDAFGQNIETESCTSLDGAVGVYSSAASCLMRDRPDLVQHVT